MSHLAKTHEAHNLQTRYVCATCWGELGMKRQKQEDGTELFLVFCLRGEENCDGQNFVTKRYVERRRQESQAELREVKMNYMDHPAFKKKQRKPAAARTESTLLMELGYL